MTRAAATSVTSKLDATQWIDLRLMLDNITHRLIQSMRSTLSKGGGSKKQKSKNIRCRLAKFINFFFWQQRLPVTESSQMAEPFGQRTLIVVRLVSSFTSFDSTVSLHSTNNHIFPFLVKFNLVKKEISCTAISVLCFGRCSLCVLSSYMGS